MVLRSVPCSGCTGKAGHGTSQVFRKVLFHFCKNCWFNRREACNAFMIGTAS